jgi:hypothetical protein
MPSISIVTPGNGPSNRLAQSAVSVFNVSDPTHSICVGNAAAGLIGWRVRIQRDGGGQVRRQGVLRNRHEARGRTSENAVRFTADQRLQRVKPG